MRLIDGDKLKICYTGTNGLDDKAEYFSIRKMIGLQPTAYDVDKVVEEIRKYADNVAELGGNFLPKVVIEIVKSGGVAND